MATALVPHCSGGGPSQSTISFPEAYWHLIHIIAAYHVPGIVLSTLHTFFFLSLKQLHKVGKIVSVFTDKETTADGRISLGYLGLLGVLDQCHLL